MVDSYFVIDGSSSEFDLNENDKLETSHIKISEPEPEEEMFWIGVTTTANNQVFQLPVRGMSFTGSQNVPYDWLIDYGDGTDIIHETGIGSPLGLINSHTYTTPGYYIIKVIPGSDNPNYGWARAFGCGMYFVANTKPYITNGGKFTWMSLAENAISVGNYFNSIKYCDCSNLIIPEDTSDWFISGPQGINFNYGKYDSCIKLTDPEDTSAWSISGSQGNYFNGYKYYNCSDLIIPEDTSAWSISGNQGNYFNSNKYLGCTILSSLEDWSGFSELSTTSTSQSTYLCYHMYYLDNPNTTLTGDTSVIRSKFPSEAQDNPPYPIATFHNRTGLSDYDSLDLNWK